MPVFIRGKRYGFRSSQRSHFFSTIHSTMHCTCAGRPYTPSRPRSDSGTAAAASAPASPAFSIFALLVYGVPVGGMFTLEARRRAVFTAVLTRVPAIVAHLPAHVASCARRPQTQKIHANGAIAHCDTEPSWCPELQPPRLWPWHFESPGIWRQANGTASLSGLP